MRQFLVILALVLMSGGAQAQGKEITLASDPELEASGLWSYVLPRFKLKTGIKVHVTYGTDDTRGDMKLSQEGATLVMVHEDGMEFRATLNRPSPHGERFLEWLTSEVGQRTISAFEQDGRQLFFPPVVKVTEESALFEGNVAIGEDTSIAKCGRCHVISERNKFGGIDSTPSFGALKTLEDWQARFQIFWTLNPHPSFTQIEGVTEPFDPAYPPHIYPIYLTVEEVRDIGAYMQTITPKELGPLLDGE